VPIESPQLDDLRFTTVVEQLRRQIPAHTPEWTDHNESDPGITMMQLFGHLAEQIGFRLNRLPDKAYVEMLKLVGVRLRPATPARTTLAFYLAKPETTTGFAIGDGTRVMAKSTANPPPIFETTRAVDGVPAQPVALVTTASDDLRELQRGQSVNPAAPATTALPPLYSLAWDGRSPKLKDWPELPVRLGERPTEANHRCLWIGVAGNLLPSAAFVGQRVALTVSLDDDERPDAQALADCSVDTAGLAEELGRAVELVYYQPSLAGAGAWRRVRVLSDSTFGLTRSGEIRFDVPVDLGAIPDGEWKDVPLTPAVPHPLVGALKTPVTGAPVKVPTSTWFGLRAAVPLGKLALRALTWNAAPAVAALTIKDELLGRGTGRSDQTVRTSRANVLSDSLELVIEDPAAVPPVYHRYRSVENFDAVGPDDRVYVLDPEAGTIYFGDGLRGRVPALDARIVAVRYRHGGGAASEVGVARVTQGQNLPVVVQDVTNPVPARGGRDAETLDQAKARAPREFRTLGRAVTAEDYALLAEQTPGLRVARTVVIPLRRPYTAEGLARPGVDVSRVAPGALSVVVVPDGVGRYLAPTESALTAVCRHLDRYRLVTTELYVVAPQYVRLFDVTVTVTPRPGYTKTQLRELIAARLEQYLHVLTGGPDGTGYPFGTTLYQAELVAQVFRVEGVDRVEELTARYDGRDGVAVPPMVWRAERATARNLVGCPGGPLDDDRLDLYPDESVFIDLASLNVIIPA
jgi:predicted phage baseplate assembly protein